MFKIYEKIKKSIQKDTNFVKTDSLLIARMKITYSYFLAEKTAQVRNLGGIKDCTAMRL